MNTLLIALLAMITIGCTRPSDFYAKNHNLGSTDTLNGIAPATGNNVVERNNPNQRPNPVVPVKRELVAATETFKQNSNQKLDILWVVDNSGSMNDEQVELGKNFDLFIKSFLTKNVDFKMAITTTDTSAALKGVMVVGSEEKLNSKAAKLDPNQFINDFNDMVKVGTQGASAEKGLEASEAFVLNSGSTFLRKDAYLAVVIISDEEDQSTKSPAQYAEELKKLKINPGLIKIFSIVDVTLSNPELHVSRGFKRYAQASAATSGSVLDIRLPFSETLTEMSESMINLLDSIALAAAPVEGTLKVYVNGKLTEDYSYDAKSRSILFNTNAVPAANAEIKVKYNKFI